MTAIKATHFDDKGITVVVLPYGTYRVDGHVVNVEDYRGQECCVKDADNIRRITVNRSISHYEDVSGLHMDEAQYREHEYKLGGNRASDGDGGFYFTNLEEEYAYRRFCAAWQPIFVEKVTESDPLPVASIRTRIDSGNPFIISLYTTCESDHTLFEYNRPQAVLKIVEDCFTSLGMEYKRDCNYASTQENRIWGNSTHSGIRYVTAFGAYIFDDNWHIRSNMKGTLESMLAAYEKDKQEIEQIIKSKYAVHFGKVAVSGVQAKTLLSLAESANNLARDIDPKKGSLATKTALRNKLMELIDKLQKACVENC